MRCVVRVLSFMLFMIWRYALSFMQRTRTLEPQPSGVVHVGATESFGAELHSLRDVEVSPELISDIETELRWGLIWHEFETHLQIEVDRIFAHVLEFADCQSFDEVREFVEA